MPRWLWVVALVYLGINVWIYGPTAYEVFLEPAVQGAMK